MTEYEHEEGFEEADDEPSIYDEIAEVRGMLEQQQEEDRINSEIRQLEAAHGSPFSEHEVQDIGRMIDQGHDPTDAYAAVAPESEAEQDYAATVEQFERQEGRALSTGEQERVWEAVQTGEEEIELHNLDTRHGRREWAAERLSEQFEQPEVPDEVVPPADDASADERKSYMEARLRGAKASDWPYQSPASESGVDYE